MKQHILFEGANGGAQTQARDFCFSLPQKERESTEESTISDLSSFLYISTIYCSFFSVSVGTAAAFVSHGVLGMIHICRGNIRSHVALVVDFNLFTLYSYSH